MKRAQTRDAVHQEKFYFCKNTFPTQQRATPSHSLSDSEVTEMDLNTIFNGNVSKTLLASFPGLLSPNTVEGLVKLVRRMTSGGRLEAWHFRWTAVLCMHGTTSHASRRPPDIILRVRPGNKAKRLPPQTTVSLIPKLPLPYVGTSPTPIFHYNSLVPRLPRSGTWTLKLCRRGEPGIFCHVRSGKR